MGADLNTKGAKTMNEKLRAEMEKANPYGKRMTSTMIHERGAFNEGYTAAANHLLPDLEKLAKAYLEATLEDSACDEEANTIARKYLPEGE